MSRMTEKVVRRSLWIACPFNLLAALVFALPSSAVGQEFGLPQSVSALYLSLVCLLVGLFGLAYGWLAWRPTIDRPMLGFGSIGKFGVFLIALALWFDDAVSGVVVLVALGDLAFATLWFGWLVSSRRRHAA